MRECCPTCHRPLSTPKRPILVAPVDTAQMSDAELYAHYKKTDRLETLKFWIRTMQNSSAELKAGFEAFYATVSTVTIKPADFDRQFDALKNAWRRESNARELQAYKDAGYIYLNDRWEPRSDFAIVPTVFEESGAA